MVEIGERIRTKRKQQKITQQELADQLHVSRSAISNWENSRNYPDLNSIVLLSDIFEISLDSLLREDTKMVNHISNEQKKSGRRKTALTVVTTLLAVCIIITSYSVYQNVGIVHDFFSPMQTTSFDTTSKQWQDTNTGKNIKYLQLQGPFWNKQITNVTDNPGTIDVKILNQSGNKVIQQIKIKSGDSKKISHIKLGTKYRVKITAPKGEYFINIT